MPSSKYFKRMAELNRLVGNVQGEMFCLSRFEKALIEENNAASEHILNNLINNKSNE